MGLFATINGLYGVVKDLMFLGAAKITSAPNKDIEVVPGGTGIMKVGAITPGHAPLFGVGGISEFDGDAFFDASSIVGLNQEIAGPSSSVTGGIRFQNSFQTPSGPTIFTGSNTNGFLICRRADRNVNYAIPAPTDPEFVWKSNNFNSIYGRGHIAHVDDDFQFQTDRGGFAFEVIAQYAQGTMTLTGLPTATDTFVINATTCTAVASGASTDEFDIGADEDETIDNIVAMIVAGTEAANVKAWNGTGNTVVFEWMTAGVAGNAITFTEAMDNTTIDGSGTLGATHLGMAAGTPAHFEENLSATLPGGQFRNVTTVNAATYDLLITDYILHVTYTGTAAVTSLTLMTAQTTAGRVIIIKDAGGNASVNNITIDTEGAETIDGAATLVMTTDYERSMLYSDGSHWFVGSV